MLKLATLFSGIGAVEQALIRMRIDHEIVFACDNGEIEIQFDIEKVKAKIDGMSDKVDKKRYVDELYASLSKRKNYVKASYLANYRINPDDFHLDVRLLDGKDYAGKVDLLVGGSPCQSFSTVGFQGGLSDARGTLFYDYARIIQEVKPKVFIYENVRGLTTHDGGRTWAKMKRVFEEELRYRISEPKVLNAADFGIPQTRRRLFVIGVRDDLECEPFEYPCGIGAENLPFFMQDILEENCAYDPDFPNYYYDSDGAITIRKIKGKPDKKYVLTPKVRDYVLKSGTKGFRTSTKTDMRIARTLLKTMTQHHRAGVDNYITVGFEQDGTRIVRSLTERESLRLMGFPDTFKIVVSTPQIFRQAGNSIVVDVMMALVQSIIDTDVFGTKENCMKFKRIDAFDMNFEECSAAKKYKLISTTGIGEKRIYAGHDEAALDEFFDLDNIESFLMLKKDLEKYLVDAKDEFLNPVQDYKEDIGVYYNANVVSINALSNERIVLHFSKKYDSQHRYYLNFRDVESSKNWDIFRNIALPRVTKLNFVKVNNLDDGKLYIYIKPTFFMDERDREAKIIIEDLITGDKAAAENRRKGQVKWRRELLDLMPACVITKVTEDRILEACHIKPFNKSTEEEIYDVNNGLILTPTYHRLFDIGFISFADNGSILVSPFLSNLNKQRLGLNENNRYRIPKECSVYMSYHRNNVFNRIPDSIL